MSLRNDPERQERFLEVLKVTGNFAEAARQASPHSEAGCLSTFKNWLRDSPEASARAGEALEHFRASLVAAAVTRGRDGTLRPIFQKGRLVGHERVYSDSLLTLELKKHFPSEYSERHQHDHRHTVIQPQGEWRITLEDLSCLSPAEKESLAAIMDRVREGRGERKAIEHQNQKAIEAEYTEINGEEAEYASFDLGAEGDD